ncbi:EAL domain-containing protein [uncultured Jannaschia sp.]|uniref:EAL domain-containing protein n=1 Tax=uncultured Jannaschia sp. TaxID=293347 RepID=UPI0026371192|nr:EAL domain-containing protein [uncultured Jannaschia sp.]
MGLRLKAAAALFFSALLPLGLGTLVATEFSERALRTEVENRLERSLSTDLQQIEREFSLRLDDLTTISEAGVMQDVLIADDAGEIAASLSTLRKRYREFGALIVADEFGNILASDGIQTSADLLAQTEQFQATLSGEAAVSKFGEAYEIAGNSVLMSVPIRAAYDSDTVIGALAGVVAWDKFQKRLASLSIDGNTQSKDRLLTLTTDGGSRVIYETEVSAADPEVAKVREAMERTTPLGVVSEQHYLIMSMRLPAKSPFGHLDLSFHSAVAERVALSGAKTLKRDLIITASLLAIALVPLGWFGSRSMTGPLVAMSSTMSRITRNTNHSREWDMAGSQLLSSSVQARNDEIGLLGRSFAALMDQLSAARRELIEKSEAEINKRRERLDAALDNMSQGLCMFDNEHQLIVHNRRFLEMHGLTLDAIKPGMEIEEVIRRMQRAGNYTSRLSSDLADDLTVEMESRKPHFFSDQIQGERSVAVSQVPLENGGCVITFEDTTERRRAEARMEYLAHHDELTGLPNRTTFRKELDRALAFVRRGGELAVFCLDLDHFKSVNDTLGHPIGDRLLQQVADRLRSCVRETDVIARLGGDEFAILAHGAVETPSALADRVIETLSAPFEIDGHQVVVGASVGIALAPTDGNDPHVLVKAADLALYRAKSDGRGVHSFYQPEMDAKLQARRALELDLRAALAKDEFYVTYQPIINVATDQVACFEALLRWRHSERGLVPPDQFIALAEDIGLIHKIGAWVLRQACRDAATWPSDIRVAVNLSPVQFKNPALVSEVEAALIESGLGPRRLELEITETVLLNQTDATLEVLIQLRDLGVRISMDDFGTGYSSLSYLRKFPFDKIKIDRSFISDLPDSPDALAIIRAISGLGSSLHMSTTAEGVETLTQLEAIRAEGCTEVQGYLYSPSVEAAEVMHLLQKFTREERSVA